MPRTAPIGGISASTWAIGHMTWQPIARYENYWSDPSPRRRGTAPSCRGAYGCRAISSPRRTYGGSVGGGREWRPRLLPHQRRDHYLVPVVGSQGASGMGRCAWTGTRPFYCRSAAHRAQGDDEFLERFGGQGSASLKKCSKMAQAYARSVLRIGAMRSRKKCIRLCASTLTTQV